MFNTLGIGRNAAAAMMAAMGGMLAPSSAPALEPIAQNPRWLRTKTRNAGKPGRSPALSGPHSEPQIHIRGRHGAHYWFTQARWNEAKKALTFMPGDVVEYVDGYGAVTKRTRVPL